MNEKQEDFAARLILIEQPLRARLDVASSGIVPALPTKGDYGQSS